jgi:hypothetical protein
MKYALKLGATWGTAAVAGAGDGLLLLPTGLKQGDAALEVDDSQGLYFSVDASLGAIKADGDLPGYLRYDGCDLLLALFMGTAGVPTLHAAGTLSHDFVYPMADNTDGLFATFVRHWKNYVEEIRSLKIAALTIKGERGKPLQLIPKCIGDASVQDGENDATTYASVTLTETANRIMFSQGVFRSNAQAGAALGAGDVITPNSFELTATRKIGGVYNGLTLGSGNAARDVIDEPSNDGMPEITLKLTFPRHTAKTRLTDLGSDSRLKMDMTFTGALIEGAIPRTFKLELPHLQYKSVDIVDEAGIIKEPVEFLCHGCTAAPTGMATLTQPLRISGTNQRDSDPLA